MISRSEWSIPEGSVEWIRLLCLEMGVENQFWLHRPYWQNLTRREMMTMTLVILRLRLRHEWTRTEMTSALRMASSNFARYYNRGRALLAVDPIIERAFTKLEGHQAVEFLIVNWYVNFQVMFDQEGVAAE